MWPSEGVCERRRWEERGTGARAGEIRERSAFILHLACSLQLKNNPGLLTEQGLPGAASVSAVGLFLSHDNTALFESCICVELGPAAAHALGQLRVHA